MEWEYITLFSLLGTTSLPLPGVRPPTTTAGLALYWSISGLWFSASLMLTIVVIQFLRISWELSLIYLGLVIVRLRRYRKDFAAVLHSSNSNLTRNRFMRLFIASLILIVIFLPVQLYVFYRNASFPLQPYDWDAIHGPDWWTIIMIPTSGVVQFDRWIRIALGFTVFSCFGMGQDAVALYRSWLVSLGLGRIFARLHRQNRNSRRTLSNEGRSFGSRARMLFSKQLSSTVSTLSLYVDLNARHMLLPEY